MVEHLPAEYQSREGRERIRGGRAEKCGVALNFHHPSTLTRIVHPFRGSRESTLGQERRIFTGEFAHDRATFPIDNKWDG